MQPSLTGRVALVTGADDELGQAIAAALAREGAAIAAIAAEPGAAAASRSEIVDAGGTAIELAADLTDEQQVMSAFASAAEQLGGIDILVNHASPLAGAGEHGLHEIPVGAWSASIERHSTSAFVATKNVAPHMRKRDGGRVINITSSLTHRCFDEVGVARLMVHGLTIGFAREYGADGITVNTIAVGELTDGPPPASPQNRAIVRAGAPSDMLGLLIALAADTGGWTTGQIFTIDGGAWMRPV